MQELKGKIKTLNECFTKWKNDPSSKCYVIERYGSFTTKTPVPLNRIGEFILVETNFYNISLVLEGISLERKLNELTIERTLVLSSNGYELTFGLITNFHLEVASVVDVIIKFITNSLGKQ